MGSYRLFLALVVLVSHTELKPQGVAVGISAVVSFFILSGYVMTLLVDRHYASPERVPHFYLDRVARIFPQYLFYLVSTIVLVNQHRVTFGFVETCDAVQAALNFAVFPLNWSRMVSINCLYLPQAWTLALELTFYLIVPFLIYSRYLVRTTGLLSCCIFVAAFATLVDTETYGYRTLPGTLFMFMAGMALARRDIMTPVFPVLVWFAAVGLLSILYFDGNLRQQDVSRDVLVGLVIGLPAVAVLRRVKSSRLDEVLGNLSYGVFLNHLLCMYVLEQVLGFRIDSVARLCVLIGVATLLSLLTYHVVEKPVLAFRRGLRRGAPTAQLLAARGD